MGSYGRGLKKICFFYFVWHFLASFEPAVYSVTMSQILQNRGLSGRETGRKQHDTIDKITFENVHNATTFFLRQELMKRGRFQEGSEESIKVNHEILMAAMVGCLVVDKEKADGTRLIELEQARLLGESTNKDGNVIIAETLAEKLQRQKEERKAEAVQRSLARQNLAYFKEKREINKRAQDEREKENEEKKKKNKVQLDSKESEGSLPGPSQQKQELDEDDPFRSSKFN